MDVTLRDLKELMTADTEAPDDGGFKVRQKVFVRTVTHYYLGLVEAVTRSHVVLSSASWVADTGLFSVMLADGTIDEVEPFADAVYVSRGAIIDHTPWRHSLPQERK